MSVTAASGFLASAMASGIKPDGPDLALVATGREVQMAAVFTTSLAAAAPVLLSRERSMGGVCRAVVINSGCANAGTGERGMADAMATTNAVAGELGCVAEEVLVCSTGPIGTWLPIDKMLAAIPELVAGLDVSTGGDAALAILTTDKVTKEATVYGDRFVVGGMAKGAAMLRPSMATMLAVLTTDADVDSVTLDRVLRQAVEVTFNCLDVDGCQSTNDTVVLMASGEAGHVDESKFAEAVEETCRRLARQMAADAEGASKIVDLVVTGTSTDNDARQIARTVADSALVRSSFWGADPNWGRVLAAAGVAGVVLAVDEVRIVFGGVVVCDSGQSVDFDESVVIDAMNGDFVVEIAVGDGPGRAEVVTTDLTPEYVRFNGERS